MSQNKYSVLLPTYEEAENLPLIVWLLIETFEAKFAFLSVFIRPVEALEGFSCSFYLYYPLCIVT